MPHMNIQREGRPGDHDPGPGGCVLLYDAARETVLLTRRFSAPAHISAKGEGALLEGALMEVAVASLGEGGTDGDVRREAEEGIGVRIGEVQHVLDASLNPGFGTERLHFYAATYDRTGTGGSGVPGDSGVSSHNVAAGRGTGHAGHPGDGEHGAVLELSFADALAAIRSGDIADAKTILLLQWAALEGPFAGTGVGGGAARVGAVNAHAEREQASGDGLSAPGEQPETD
jgi:hypothetical protein